MAVTFELPSELEEKLRAEFTDINAKAKEAYALELFRQGKVSHHELSMLLGLDRFETDGYLKRHNVFEGSLTMEDLKEQTETLDRVLGPVQC